MDKPRLDLRSFDTYRESSIDHLKWQIRNYFNDHTTVDISHIHQDLHDFNAYENIDHLEPLCDEHVIILDEEKLDIAEAEKVVLEGEFFWEHAAAGEATRLGLGTKYLLKLSDFSLERISEMIRTEVKNEVKDPDLRGRKLEWAEPANLVKEMGCRPEDTLPYSLGTRHMLQMAFDLHRLAVRHHRDPAEVMAKQRMLIILNESTADTIVAEWQRFNFFGFDHKNVFFMVQKSFPGIDIAAGDVSYDDSHDGHYRLHNHGHMVMQKTHDDVVFYIDKGQRRYISSDEFERVLDSAKDMVSYNIEDTKYLTGSIDWHSLAMALDLGKQGYGMVMEIVAQNPDNPQKGGAAFFDKKRGRVVMIECNQLKGIRNEDISHLNKNFNHYPNPVVAFRAVREGGLHLHTDVKKMKDARGAEKYYLYFCTPQGDINFLVKTAYVMRKQLKPIESWKSASTTPQTVRACCAQDAQPGFREFAARILGPSA